MSSRPDKAEFSQLNDCCGSASTAVRDQADGSCKSENGAQPLDVVTGSCCAREGKGNPPVSQESGCCASSCTTEALKQTEDPFRASMAEDRCCSEIGKINNPAVEDKPGSRCASAPEEETDRDSKGDGPCCDG